MSVTLEQIFDELQVIRARVERIAKTDDQMTINECAKKFRRSRSVVLQAITAGKLAVSEERKFPGGRTGRMISRTSAEKLWGTR